MDNPLDAIVDCEERQDGVYIKVPRDANKGILFKAICNALEQAHVLNADVAAVQGVVMRARAAFEKIGPCFEYYDPQFEKYLKVQVTPQKASVRLDAACIVDRLRPTAPVILHALRRNGVVHGIDMLAVQSLVAGERYDAVVDIAHWTPPVKGEDGRVEYLVDIRKDSKPLLLPNGSVDYRSIKSFTQVSKGTVLARKIPPTPGTPGRSVQGQGIPAEPGADQVLLEGEHIAVADGGHSLVAQIAGVIYEEQGFLHIGESLTIDHDIDFSIGNVKFSGKVLIRGNVRAGFIVESEEDVRIEGDVEAATVRSRNGTVTVTRGVIGKDETALFGKKGVAVGFVQNAQLSTDGVLKIERSCLHCTCICETFEMSRSDSVVVGGSVSAWSSINVVNAGSEKGTVTRLALVDRERSALKEKRSELEQLREKLQHEMIPVVKQVQTKSALFKKAGRAVTDRHREELKKWLDQYHSFKLKLDYIDKKIAEIRDRLAQPRSYAGSVTVHGTLSSGTELDLYGLTRLIKAPLVRKRVVVTDEGMIFEELSS